MKLTALPLGVMMTAGALAAFGVGWLTAPLGSHGAREARAAPVGAPKTTDEAEKLEAGPASEALPWLHNFAVQAESTRARSDVVDRMSRWRAPDASCSAVAYGGFAITANVADAAGDEEVLASYTQGVLVLDAGGKLIASATAPGCNGSADEIEAIAAGDAHVDRPVIAMAVTTGGHRESATWLVLYRVVGGLVTPAFSGVVEDHVGPRTRIGAVTLLPGALLYQAPTGMQTLWVYSAEQQRYIETARVTPPAA